VRVEQKAARQARAAAGLEAPDAPGPDHGGLADTGSHGSDSDSRSGPDGHPGARPEHPRSRRRFPRVSGLSRGMANGIARQDSGGLSCSQAIGTGLG
jgi:hypothetical protein